MIFEWLDSPKLQKRFSVLPCACVSVLYSAFLIIRANICTTHANRLEISLSSQVENVKAVLRKELGQSVVEPSSSKALLSGSDVLFTGREFFVGISQSTNTEGAVAVAATWPEYPCTPVKVSLDHRSRFRAEKRALFD